MQRRSKNNSPLRFEINLRGVCCVGQLSSDFELQNEAVSVSVSVFGVGTIWHKKEESLKPVGVLGFFMELLARFELATSSLPRMRSTG